MSTWPSVSERSKKKLPENEGKDVGTILKNIGMVVLNSVGGAMGALYGTMFLSMAQECAGKPRWTSATWCGCSRRRKRGCGTSARRRWRQDADGHPRPGGERPGKGRPGGQAAARGPVGLREAAQQGMESTRDLVAKMGRSSRLGERTRGHLDAGAASCYFMLRCFAQGAKRGAVRLCGWETRGGSGGRPEHRGGAFEWKED